MSILDAIKNSVLEGFNTNITAMDILLSLGVSLLAGLFVLLIYKNARKGVTLSGGFCLTLLLITAISAMIVLTITSNLALSLGMVGALSIVRFRTAVKDTVDTAFLFWSVAAGITAGAGFYLITFIGCLFIGAVCMVCVVMVAKYEKAYLLVARVADGEVARRIEELLEGSKLPYRLSALTQTGSCTEVVYEVAFSEQHRNLLTGLQKLAGVESVSLVDCRKN